ncbi:uncharacterized protein DFL_000400 [Arthrobotrys flagrans]|uniref:Uncharacterized protein n=1 Tax=Arthrobotrys flagrans TaxID=97331 RepID=A0A437ADN0_ARTFL|nr:hypothetical protein DFL_000400 [Arthrobotrys flagrans]
MELHHTSSSYGPQRMFSHYSLRLGPKQNSKPKRISFHGILNEIKILSEDTLGQPISFWPLCQPRAPTPNPKFFRRIFWDCDCGMEMHSSVPLDNYFGYQFVENPEPQVDTKSNSELPAKFQIFFCGEGDDGRDVMKTIKSDNLRTDKDLFQQLRRNYVKIRGWKLWFSFTHVHDIRFVWFWRGRFVARRQEGGIFRRFFRNNESESRVSYGADLCNIEEEDVPPIDDDEYSIAYHHQGSWLVRPMSRQAIMDHFSNPSGGRADASDCLRYAMPKKLTPTTRSGFSALWGLYAEEAICPAKVVIWGLVAHLFCIGGYVPWWVVSVMYFGIVLDRFVARTRRNRRCGFGHEFAWLP